jgi:hypothetical protein
MRRVFRAFKESDADSAFFKQWVGNTQTVHGAVFGYVESLIVLAALQFSAEATSSWLVWALYFIGYAMQIILTSVYFRAALMMLVNKANLTGWPRHSALWVSGLGALALNTWLAGALGQALKELLAAGLSP